MSDWITDAAAGPRTFPTVRHRHPNGTLDTVRDRRPDVVQRLGEPAIKRWTWLCPCGDVWTWERPRSTLPSG